MTAFNELFEEIDRTTSTNAKIEALVRYFQSADDGDLLWCIYLLMGKSTGRFVKTAVLRQTTVQLSQLSAWLFEESYHVVGDLAETISLCLPSPLEPKANTLTETMIFLNDLKNSSDEDAVMALSKRWMHIPSNQRFVFNKLITGNFRMGVSKQLVIKALAVTFNKPESEMAHRLMGNWHPSNTQIQQLLLTSLPKHERSFEPYPFYLAYQLDKKPEDLGEVDEWIIERKYDGIRGQIIVRNKGLYIWSRGEDLLTDKFPEFHVLADLLPNGTVIDGEILPFKDNEVLPFSVMQTRIGRKQLSKKILADAPLVMICYDLLEFEGEDIRDQPLEKRRGLLVSLLARLPADAPLLISAALPCATWQEVAHIREKARLHQCEGVMLKKRDSIYETGRRRGNWWKWKVDPYTIDGVLIYGQRGHGRRANLYTDYTFAVWDEEELVPFAKAYSGLTDREIGEVDAWIKRHTIDKFGPVRSVTPTLVFELAFEGINPSPRHKSGIALRFPRIVRWRKDKSAKDANTKADLLALLK